jgi:hypothetical protein
MRNRFTIASIRFNAERYTYRVIKWQYAKESLTKRKKNEQLKKA